MKLLEGRLHGTLTLTPGDHLDSRSILLGSLFHLTHHLLNQPYPPNAYKSRLTPHGEQSYTIALTFMPKSVG